MITQARAVLSLGEVATELRLLRRNGEPNRDVVRQLIRSGKLAIVDDTQPVQRWTVSRTELERYIEHGPRRVA